jgi:hypothetical protein
MSALPKSRSASRCPTPLPWEFTHSTNCSSTVTTSWPAKDDIIVKEVLSTQENASKVMARCIIEIHEGASNCTMLKASVYSLKGIEKMMISLDVKIKESLERDNLLHCVAIVVACTGFDYWLIALSMALSTGSKSAGVKVLLRCSSVMWYCYFVELFQ